MAIYSDSGFITARSTPLIRPTLDLNFAREKRLDSRVLFTRGSSGTYIDEGGVIRIAANNVPRFDHDPETGESLGLLVEESRTNLVTTSKDFGSFDQNYVNARSTIASTTELAPDGTYTATKLVRTSGQGQGEVSIIKSGISGVTSGNTYTSSLFVKYLPGSNSSVVSFNNVDSISGESDSEFNLLTGVIVTEGNQHTTSIIPYPNGWYRIILSNRTASTNGAYFWIRSYNQNEGEGFLLWGAQIEVGSFPTSYIPTSGSTVTRAADLASISGTNFAEWYNPTESTVLVESLNAYNQFPSSHNGAGFGFYTTGGFFGGGWSFTHGRDRHINLDNGYGSDWRTIHSAVVSDAAQGYISTHYNATTFPIITNNGNAFYKAAMCISSSSINVSSGGYISETSGTVVLPNPKALAIGRDPNYSVYSRFNGLIKNISYWPKQLSSTQLQALTS
jgi:hypothetical protein